jgi:hypothetical protein
MDDDYKNQAFLPAETILQKHYANGGRWLTAGAVARRWACHPSSVYRLLVDGKLPFLRLGVKAGLRISSVWVERFERENLNRLD